VGSTRREKLAAMSDLFFNPRFQEDLSWPGSLPLQVGTVLPHNKREISAGLKDLSSASIRNRFMGSKKEFTSEELVYLSHLDGWNHYALGLLEKSPSTRGVAIVRMVRSSTDAAEAEVALTIIDEYQRRGLGTFLLRLIVLAAKERKIHRLSFTFLRDNEGIARLLRKFNAELTQSPEGETIQKILSVQDADTREIIARLRPSLPAIDGFHLET
jgi:GNAT superfamily N-acetyltransferase